MSLFKKALLGLALIAKGAESADPLDAPSAAVDPAVTVVCEEIGKRMVVALLDEHRPTPHAFAVTHAPTVPAKLSREWKSSLEAALSGMVTAVNGAWPLQAEGSSVAKASTFEDPVAVSE